MNYTTSHFVPERIVPRRNLRLPVIERATQFEGGGGWRSPKLLDGRLCNASAPPDGRMAVVDEVSFEEIASIPQVHTMLSGVTVLSPTEVLYIEVEHDQVSLVEGVQIPYRVNVVTGVAREMPKWDEWMNDSGELLAIGHMLLLPLMERDAGFHLDREELIWELATSDGERKWAAREQDGCLIRLDTNRNVERLDLWTGEVVWSTSARELGIEPTDREVPKKSGVLGYPHIFEEIVVCSDLMGWAALDLETGKLLWHYSATGGTSRYPVVTEEGFLYHAGCNCLRVLDIRSGEMKDERSIALADHLGVKEPPWQGGINISTCDVTDTHLWVAMQQKRRGEERGPEVGFLLAVNLKSAEVDWYTEIAPHPLLDGPVICNNRLYMRCHDRSYIFEGAGGYIPD